MAYTITGTALTTIPAKLTTTGVTDLFDATKRTTILSVVATEITGNTPDYTLELYDGTTSYYIYSTKALVADTPLIYSEPFVLPSGWKLRATAGAANQIDVFVTYAEPDATIQQSGFGAYTK
jgi:hypothetical protein